MKVTFVTSFIDAYNKNVVQGKTLDWRFDHFEKIAKLNLNIYLFITQNLYDIYYERLLQYPNVYVSVFKMEDLWIYNTIMNQKDNINLPENRTIQKDTIEYITLMNLKIEFVKKVVDKNPFHTSYFAWIDFNINHVFKDYENTYNYLKNFQNNLTGHFLFLPGCWNKYESPHIILYQIHWRFCGGYFIGDRDSIINFYNQYYNYLPEFLNQYKKIVWEVNFWTWLENEKNMHFDWFAADHDDSIVKIPSL